MTAREPVLWALALAHGLLALVFLVALRVELPAITGAHPALKPLKFALSLTALLGTLAYVTPALGVGPALRAVLVWTLALAATIEMAVIVVQAARGVPSHFNTGTPLDAALWRVMGAAAIGLAVVNLGFAVAATVRPLDAPPLLAAAIRIGLWLLLLAAISGAAMGGRGAHAVGGPDGVGPALPLVGWSRAFGDLRVPHFLALHGLQALPGLALLLDRLPLPARARWAGLLVAATAWSALALVTLGQALAGRPFYDIPPR